MRIQHNIAALNSYRQLNNNNSAVSKNLEKLSSGYKINRAADDAAGLAISEKMRAQITGLTVAQKNANDGISLVQTAEGALTEVHDMLNRMKELATQASNGTYSDDDRAKLQSEINALNSEIDRISEGTNFNGINLLDGSMGAAAKVTTTAGTNGTATIVATTAQTAVFTVSLNGATGMTTGGSPTLEIAGQTITASGTLAGSGTSDLADVFNGQTVTIGGTVFDISAAGDTLTFTAQTSGAVTGIASGVSATLGGGTTGTIAIGITTEGKNASDEIPGTASSAAITTLDFTGKKGADVIGGTFTVDGKTYEFVTAGDTPTASGAKAITIAEDATAAEIATALADEIGATAGAYDVAAAESKVTFTAQTVGAGTEPIEVKAGGGGLSLQIGDTADTFNKLNVSVSSMDSKSLGLDGVNIGTEKGASAAIDAIDKAIDMVSTTRSDLGAIQNRLEHTINNLGVTTENLTSAESRIRDTDMADEMMAYTKNNILVQAAQAMLAQANTVPQGVLQLLQ